MCSTISAVVRSLILPPPLARVGEGAKPDLGENAGLPAAIARKRWVIQPWGRFVGLDLVVQGEPADPRYEAPMAANNTAKQARRAKRLRPRSTPSPWPAAKAASDHWARPPARSARPALPTARLACQCHKSRIRQHITAANDRHGIGGRHQLVAHQTLPDAAPLYRRRSKLLVASLGNQGLFAKRWRNPLQL